MLMDALDKTKFQGHFGVDQMHCGPSILWTKYLMDVLDRIKCLLTPQLLAGQHFLYIGCV